MEEPFESFFEPDDMIPEFRVVNPSILQQDAAVKKCIGAAQLRQHTHPLQFPQFKINGMRTGGILSVILQIDAVKQLF